MAYGPGDDEVVLLFSEESIEHSRKVAGNAFAEAQAHVGLGPVATTWHHLL
jgi:hypothetical protein